MSVTPRGALVHQMAQTFTRSNWPFAAFLLFLGFVLAIPAWQMGNHGIALALLFLGVGVAFGFFVIERLAIWARSTVLAVYENGLLVLQRGESFVPWSALERLETWTAIVEVVVDEEVTFMRAVTRDGRTIPLGSSGEVHAAVRSHSGLTPTDLGRRSGWGPH